METTRTEKLIGVVLVLTFLLFLQWLRPHTYKEPQLQKPQGQTTQGPNPDGSWGRYEEPMVKVTAVMIDHRTRELTLLLTISIVTGESYTTRATLPFDPTIGDKLNGDN